MSTLLKKEDVRVATLTVSGIPYRCRKAKTQYLQGVGDTDKEAITKLFVKLNDILKTLKGIQLGRVNIKKGECLVYGTHKILTVEIFGQDDYSMTLEEAKEKIA